MYESMTNPRRLFEHKQSETFEQKRLAKPFSVQATDDAGTFEGHGAVFDALHTTSSWMLGPEWKDIIKPGAFERSLAEHKKRGSKPSMLYMHERGNVIGVWHEVKEDGDGLFNKGQLALSARAPSGATIYELLKMGAITGLSIGFRVRKHTLDQEKKVREIHDVDLGEVSIVDDPGGPTARITDVKFGDPKNPRFLERLLREAGLSRKEAKALLAFGFSALRDAAADDDDQREAEPAPKHQLDADLVSSIKGLAASINR